jgi:hypothetical protein
MMNAIAEGAAVRLGVVTGSSSGCGLAGGGVFEQPVLEERCV